MERKVIVSGKEEIKEQPSSGIVQAVCSGVYDIGIQPNDFGGKPKHQVIIRFELDELMKEGEFAGKRFTVNEFFNADLRIYDIKVNGKKVKKKTKLREWLEIWRNKPFTDEELEQFDLMNLIGANCQVNITYKESGKAKISSIIPLGKGMQKMTPELDTKEVPNWVNDIVARGLQEKVNDIFVNDSSEVIESEQEASSVDVPF